MWNLIVKMTDSRHQVPPTPLCCESTTALRWWTCLSEVKINANALIPLIKHYALVFCDDTWKTHQSQSRSIHGFSDILTVDPLLLIKINDFCSTLTHWVHFFSFHSSGSSLTLTFFLPAPCFYHPTGCFGSRSSPIQVQQRLLHQLSADFRNVFIFGRVITSLNHLFMPCSVLRPQSFEL